MRNVGWTPHPTDRVSAATHGPFPARLRVRLRVGAVGALLVALLPATLPVAVAHADTIDQLRARVRQDQQDRATAVAVQRAAEAAKGRAQGSAATTQAAIGHTNARLAAANTAAEIASEALNEAQIQLAAAADASAAAQRRYRAADAVWRRLRAQASGFAVDAYKGGGAGLATLEVLTSRAGPATFLDRVTSLAIVSRNQHDIVTALRRAADARAKAAAQAKAALADQRRVTAVAQARADALQRSAAQVESLLATLRSQEATLQAQAQAAAARASSARNAAAAAAARGVAHQAQVQAAVIEQQRRAAAAAAAALRAEQERRAREARNAGGSGHSDGPSVGPPPLGSGGASVAVSWAYRMIGRPYVWGATGPSSFDCSGLTMYVWAKAGVRLPHYSAAQYWSLPKVSQGSLRPGDLVFFGSPIHHVGIYVGGGYMIDAPHTGALVRREPVWWGSYVGAARP